MNNTILVVDDEKAIVDILEFNLRRDGYEVIKAYNGEDGLKLFREKNPDLVLLDIMMPKIDGLQVCKEIRSESNTPIIMLTAKAEEVDKVIGLEFGADDYVTKPFSVREVLARVKANIRRRAMDVKELDQAKELTFDHMVINLDRYEVRKSDVVIDLTVREYELLVFLATQKEQIFTREQLLEKVWGYEYFGDVRTVDVTVRRLREKVEEDSSNPKYVLTKRGIGYYFKG
ncbi:MAG: DNA-binding response regulator [Firmicutes bacterium HGW-Firmicutes-1]|jgi:two-component system response regulator VicR|nr:MAG: DNA-binding response regulator [Firmicutes bacterium HGW-Firmicutes-1]